MTYDIIIIGGGIVGLATAMQLKESRPLLNIALIEKEDGLAEHQTGHNSGVIHSGIYYKPGSLKAINCVSGYQLLLDFCRREGVPFEVCGKIIVATRENELPMLEEIYRRGTENGLTGLKKLQKEEINAYEPHVAGLKAIFVPQTGIIDYKAVSYKYAEIFQNNGGEIFLGEQVLDIKTGTQQVEVFTSKRSYTTRLLINCAGLYSDKVAGMTMKNINVRIIPFRGEYYKIVPEKEYLVKSLVYPVPDPNFPFLGVHFTRMINGGVEAGPNAVFAFKREGYKKTDFKLSETLESLSWPGFRRVIQKYWRTGLGEVYRSLSKSAFTSALQRLVPEIQEKDLIPEGAGIRAQACDKNGGLLDDFKILEDKLVINVLNAPSPAATSSLSIGTTIALMALGRF